MHWVDKLEKLKKNNLHLRINICFEREREGKGGREGGRETLMREKYGLVASHSLTRDWTQNLGMCLTRNWTHYLQWSNQCSHTAQGRKKILTKNNHASFTSHELLPFDTATTVLGDGQVGAVCTFRGRSWLYILTYCSKQHISQSFLWWEKKIHTESF